MYGKIFSICVVTEVGLQIVNTNIQEIALTAYLGMIGEIIEAQRLQ